jgi:hypothetical protein
MAFDEAVDLYQQFFVSKRQIDVVIGAGVKSLDTRIVCFAKATDEHYRNGGRPRILFDAPAQLEAVHAWHDHIAKDHVWSKRMDQIATFRAVTRRRDLVAF